MITLRVPGDKSISHRALMLAPLASGISRLRDVSAGADVRSTAAALHALGVTEYGTWAGAGSLEIDGPVRLRAPQAVIDCGNSGTTARLLLGLIAGCPLTAVLDGDGSLRRRPMARVVDPLRSAGAKVRELGEPGRLPLEVSGGGLRATEHRSPVASAQVKSALLLAGLTGGVTVTVHEPGPSRDHTELMLRAMGVVVEDEPLTSGHRVRLAPPSGPLRPLDIRVPGDFSSAAYWLALAALGGAGPGVRVEGVGLNPRRTGFLRALRALGASLDVTVTGEAAGEPLGAVVGRPSALSGIEVPPEWIPTLIDEIPVLACVAACAEGTTEIRGAAELRVKESDRVATLHRNLVALGVASEELHDGLKIEGTTRPLRGRVVTESDHRIAMSFGVLGALDGTEIEIDDRACVEVSYRGYWEELARIREAREAG